MVTAIISALTDKKIKRDIAMTGEVTLRGRVLKIGGLREKAMAAYRGGVKTVFIPSENLADLDEVDTVVKENVNFVPVTTVDKILEAAFVEEETKTRSEHIFEKHTASIGAVSQ
jgi:ATP-dependent Lon protease